MDVSSRWALTVALGALFSQGCVATPGDVARAQAPAAPVVPIDAPAPGPTEQATYRSENSSDPLKNYAPKSTQVRVVAVVASHYVITDDEVWHMVRQRPDARQGGAQREKELFQEELRRIIERELILNDFLSKIRKQKPHVMDELNDQTQRQASLQLREFKKLNQFKGDAEFEEFLKANGMNTKSLKRQLERSAMMNIYLGQFMRDKDKQKSVTLAQIERYYKDHPEDFRVDDRIQWLDLFVSRQRYASDAEARKAAEELQKSAAGGANFQQLVAARGHGDSVLRQGAGIGSKRGEIAPRELETPLFNLPAGAVSGVIETSTGYHIVKVVERDVAGIRPFDEKIQAAIRDELTRKAHKVEYDKLIDSLWRQTVVEIVPE